MAERKVLTVTYVRGGLGEDSSKFWLQRVGWQPTDVARIGEKNWQCHRLEAVKGSEESFGCAYGEGSDRRGGS